MDEVDKLLNDLTSKHDDRAEAAVRKLSAYGPEAVPVLQDLLGSSDADTRWWAVWALGEIKDPRVPPLLSKALHDPDGTVQQAAALALRMQPDLEAIPDLIALLDAGDRNLAHLATAALIALRGEAVPALIDTMEKGSHRAKLEAVRALAVIGDQRAIPVLFEALSKDSALMEFWASEGLDRMGVGMSFFKP